ncbi:hypothetical protein K9857_18970 [Pseudomonas sp. REP124]|uniref:hypothetical protein n=1 Tax=Pseudomonas sp. REP124 TaxID=2875731 RepID=UPI001CCD7AD9|nr:hypothetical protein [Pseudomonas sp. REP124]MBZ9783616.1 hypothetical protein [Pseudomonas sp. REP124]
MTSAAIRSGFVESESLPAPNMYFAASQATHLVDSVLYPAMLQMSRNGLVVGFENIAGVEDGAPMQVCLSSEKGTTVIEHPYEAAEAYQGVRVTDEQILLHQGQRVTMTYTVPVGGVDTPSLPGEITVTEDTLDLEKLGYAVADDEINGVIKLHLIEAQGGARFSIPPIKGLFRGSYVSIFLRHGASTMYVGRVISTIPEQKIVIQMPFHRFAGLLGQTVSFGYSIQMLRDVFYNRTSLNTFTVEL